MRFAKPLDIDCIRNIAATHDHIITIEDNAIAGGAGSGVAESLLQTKEQRPMLHLGYPDSFVVQGTQKELNAIWGLDSAGILKSITTFLNEELLI